MSGNSGKTVLITFGRSFLSLQLARSIDAAGVITIRYNSRLHHIGLSKHLLGMRSPY